MVFVVSDTEGNRISGVTLALAIRDRTNCGGVEFGSLVGTTTTGLNGIAIWSPTVSGTATTVSPHCQYVVEVTYEDELWRSDGQPPAQPPAAGSSVDAVVIIGGVAAPSLVVQANPDTLVTASGTSSTVTVCAVAYGSPAGGATVTLMLTHDTAPMGGTLSSTNVTTDATTGCVDVTYTEGGVGSVAGIATITASASGFPNGTDTITMP